ncbi:hypothetical protein [Actinoplanes teichomyceticus]|nr:hypothetical protein [Actinoplanes teichomyceticus]GIF10735.1 hypothetical protein Ate01nite_07670 [Actinoplanes teichomyceticus]
MADVVKWWSRMTAALTGAVLALVIPAHAWAAGNGVAEVAVEAAKRRSRRGGFGLLFGGGLCCLLVIGAVVLVVLLISRNRKRR